MNPTVGSDVLTTPQADAAAACACSFASTNGTNVDNGIAASNAKATAVLHLRMTIAFIFFGGVPINAPAFVTVGAPDRKPPTSVPDQPQYRLAWLKAMRAPEVLEFVANRRLPKANASRMNDAERGALLCRAIAARGGAAPSSAG